MNKFFVAGDVKFKWFDKEGKRVSLIVCHGSVPDRMWFLPKFKYALVTEKSSIQVIFYFEKGQLESILIDCIRRTAMIDVTMNREVEGGHGNLLLSLEPIGFSQVADTYYFALDMSFRKDDESEEKVILNLRNLLRCWFSAVENLEDAGVTYLPFDFSDQYIGCLRVAMRDGQNLLIDYGYTRKFDGSSFNPSHCKAFVLGEKDYSKNTDSFVCARSAVLSGINRSIDKNFAGPSSHLPPGAPFVP